MEQKVKYKGIPRTEDGGQSRKESKFLMLKVAKFSSLEATGQTRHFILPQGKQTFFLQKCDFPPCWMEVAASHPLAPRSTHTSPDQWPALL